MPTIRFEAIKPPKFNSDQFYARLEWAVDQTIKEAKGDFEATCADFEHKPRFEVEKSVTEQAIASSVSTNDENYVRLNRGVKGGYKIPKAGPKLLVFREGYTAKTMPGVLKSRPGGAHGDLIFRHTQVTAKGFPGRHFDQLIKTRNEPWFKQRVRVAYREAARASGHGAR